MKKILIFVLVANLSLLAADEPSAYGAGNLDSDSPYGLSSSEKNILKNRKNLDKLSKKIAELKSKLSSIEESNEGIKSVTEGYASKIAKIDSKLAMLDEKSSDIDKIKEELSSLKLYVDESRKLQDKNQEKIKIVLEELGSLIDSINNSYVSKDKFKALETKVNTLLKRKNINSSSTTQSGAELLKSGVAHFKKRDYNKAKEIFTELTKRNYKPARSNFYLGEIAYFQKSYKTAIKRYKKSISLYDKAEYIPTLLYHTGISFSKLKNPKQAKQFFDALKQGYPDSKEAKSLN
jgi:TolA-binding protein